MPHDAQDRQRTPGLTCGVPMAVRRTGQVSSRRPLDGLVSRRWRPDARSAVEHRPADVISQPLIVNYELANRLRELVTLPPALESPCGLILAFRRGSTCRFDRVGGRTELVRGDMCDGPGLAGRVRGMPCCSTQVSGRAHCLAARCASLGHRDLATYPGAGMLDRLTRSWVLRLGRLEKVKDVLRARRRPKSEELVIRIGEGGGGGSSLSRSESLEPSGGSWLALLSLASA